MRSFRKLGEEKGYVYKNIKVYDSQNPIHEQNCIRIEKYRAKNGSRFLGWKCPNIKQIKTRMFKKVLTSKNFFQILKLCGMKFTKPVEIFLIAFGMNFFSYSLTQSFDKMSQLKI